MLSRNYVVYDGTNIIDSGNREFTWDQVRHHREQLLKNSDWRAGKDVVLSTAWKDYRQFLRDLPQDHASANDAVDNWPEAPE